MAFVQGYSSTLSSVSIGWSLKRQSGSHALERMDGGRAVTLRPAKANDFEFAFRVERETMREYAIATWGSVERSPDHLRLLQLFLKVNPAQELYKRIGFSVTNTTPEHIYMEYVATNS